MVRIGGLLGVVGCIAMIVITVVLLGRTERLLPADARGTARRRRPDRAVQDGLSVRGASAVEAAPMPSRDSQVPMAGRQASRSIRDSRYASAPMRIAAA